MADKEREAFEAELAQLIDSELERLITKYIMLGMDRNDIVSALKSSINKEEV